MDYAKGFCRVLQNKEIAQGFYDLVFEHPRMAELAKPGQFVHVVCGAKTLRRPISICGIDAAAGTIRMVYQVRGEGTQWLSLIRPGDELDILGPLGHGFERTDAEPVIFIGGGIGVPPLLEAAKCYDGRAEAILGFRGTESAILLDDFSAACKTVAVATDDGSMGHHGFVTDILKQRLADGPCGLICACGPLPMLKLVAGLAQECDVPCQVSMEQRMGCGVGACLVCSCKTKLGKDERYVQVCQYGPVMDAKEVVW